MVVVRQGGRDTPKKWPRTMSFASTKNASRTVHSGVFLAPWRHGIPASTWPQGSGIAENDTVSGKYDSIMTYAVICVNVTILVTAISTLREPILSELRNISTKVLTDHSPVGGRPRRRDVGNPSRKVTQVRTLHAGL